MKNLDPHKKFVDAGSSRHQKLVEQISQNQLTLNCFIPFYNCFLDRFEFSIKHALLARAMRRKIKFRQVLVLGWFSDEWMKTTLKEFFIFQKWHWKLQGFLRLLMISMNGLNERSIVCSTTFHNAIKFKWKWLVSTKENFQHLYWVWVH